MMERALDICSGAVPSPLHPLAVHARLGLAAAYASTGDYAGANRALQLKDKDNAWVDTEKLQKGAAEGGAMDEIDPTLVATCARALSISHLMLADAEAAEEAGMRSLELSEQADNALPDTRAIGEALHCVGLARLAAGQEDAVDYLQQATRLCRAGSPSLRALVNLGAAHWWLSGAGHAHHAFVATGLETGAAGKAPPALDLVESGTAEAVAYWEEALLALPVEDGDGDGSSTVAPPQVVQTNACATPTPSNTAVDEEEEADPTPQLTLLLCASASNSIGEAKLLGARLKEGLSAPASPMGSKAAVPAEVGAASEAFALALKTLQKVEEGLQNEMLEAGSGAASESGGALSLVLGGSSTRHLEEGVQRQKARALAGLGECKHRSGEAVSAEGLFRAAVDEASPSAPFEHASALRGYQKLLADWEGRGGEQEKAGVEVQGLLRTMGLPSESPSQGRGLAQVVPACAMIHVPPWSDVLAGAMKS